MKFHAITENHLYKKAYRAGNRRSSRTVTVYILKDKAAGLLRKRNPLKQNINRIGISASKKIGGAVQRNRAKRVIREAYRMIDKNYGIKRGWLIVIVPKTACTVCSMKECLRDLTCCLRSLDMFVKADKPAETEAKQPALSESADPSTENDILRKKNSGERNLKEIQRCGR